MVSQAGARTVAGRSVNGIVALAFGAVFVVVGLAGFLVSGGHPAVGPSGGEILGMLTTAVHAEVPTDTLRSMIYAYPTFHRAVESALADLS